MKNARRFIGRVSCPVFVHATQFGVEFSRRENGTVRRAGGACRRRRYKFNPKTLQFDGRASRGRFLAPCFFFSPPPPSPPLECLLRFLINLEPRARARIEINFRVQEAKSRVTSEETKADRAKGKNRRGHARARAPCSSVRRCLNNVQLDLHSYDKRCRSWRRCASETE